MDRCDIRGSTYVSSSPKRLELRVKKIIFPDTNWGYFYYEVGEWYLENKKISPTTPIKECSDRFDCKDLSDWLKMDGVYQKQHNMKSELVRLEDEVHKGEYFVDKCTVKKVG